MAWAVNSVSETITVVVPGEYIRWSLEPWVFLFSGEAVKPIEQK